VGLRSLSYSRDYFDETAKFIRNRAPGALLMAGGPYPSCSHRKLLEDEIVDLVVIGEGERTFAETLGRLQNENTLPCDVAGTAVRDNGRVILNQARMPIADLDSLPFPDYGKISLPDYNGISNHSFQDASKSAFICSSRGCPYHCFYCHQLFGKKVRRRSARNVVEEIRRHIEERNISSFVFVDDIFNVPQKRAKEILRLIIDELPPIRINFPNGLRADQLDDELIDLLEAAGAAHMALAVETASPRLQKIVGKNLVLDRAKDAIQKASEKFAVCCFFMIGFPSETFEEAEATISFAADLKHVAQPALSMVRVYPGTTLHALLEPDQEQAKALAIQEQNTFQPKLFGETTFYGDLFETSKVPLKSKDIQKLRWQWMRKVLTDKDRIRNSHAVLKKLFNQNEISNFYKHFYDDPKFNEESLQNLLS